MARVNFEYINTQRMLNCRISDFTESTKNGLIFFSVILNEQVGRKRPDLRTCNYCCVRDGSSTE